MGKRPFGLLLSVTIIVGLSGGRSILVGAERVDVFPLVLIVHDRANVFPATLDQALKEAARIYRQAGISTEWLPATGSAANVGLPSPRAFTVQLIIQAKLERSTTDPRSS